ncbi:AbrB/MazE/SpoVT family DNA-binding domain-containing protein [Desulfobacter vibrioformis]|uniref:AbrB/MazE/SpoVT family DNA-binding domain-containing protein n=1 Tax=Desulfobacter vibrioformis TaxID=34031 RepID=UPI00054EE0CB|nr:AbrB/MazE/SpoVT family DNA-binding domain-containing protein [Desulfobacter vibrioformis]
MPKVSAKRQITLPVSQCEALEIEPGDDVESFIAYGQLIIVKKKRGAARSVLKHVLGNPSMTDEESMENSLQ